ncbi:uncharacterized protein J8A68_002898 [[Candida] subhashii]|uniref:Membrane anchor Opy2 N-terminal domain-containing protein n=1 Tax=[Candida] subhashii TaxID=561895 RepID=A0A8J5UZV9_9ASCO|nr:uncharacterized protein J8A68_002898 [[Candida] subhashii]KAG7663649.1 hypothetical protein J8A68_002898 [[Candida] subhashii]
MPHVNAFESIRSLLPRDDSTCIDTSTCPVGVCPTCKDGFECTLIAPTCSDCPYYTCISVSPTSRQIPVGAIVGGVLGGLALIAIVGLIAYYFLIYKKKSKLSLDSVEEDLTSDEISLSKLSGGEVVSPTAVSFNSGNEPGLHPPNTRKSGNKRASVYDSFTKPGAIKNKGRNVQAEQRRARQEQIISQANRQLRQQQGNKVYGDWNRNSVATSISTTNASNILPIAYIPGVTVRPTKNNTRSVYSYETDSVFSDLNTIENASIIGDVATANRMALETSQGGAQATMTAIKAQPKLVNVDRIDEDDEYEDDDDDDLLDDDDDEYQDMQERFASSDKLVTPTAESFTTANKEMIINPNESGHESEDDDSDVDSDIGEITRATSVKREKPVLRKVRPQSGAAEEQQVIVDMNQSGIPLEFLDSKDEDTRGSFIFDVEFDHEKPQMGDSKLRESTNGASSPFADP